MGVYLQEQARVREGEGGRIKSLIEEASEEGREGREGGASFHSWWPNIMGEAAAADKMGAHSRIKETGGGGETFPLSTPHAMSHVCKGKKCKWARQQKKILGTIRLFLPEYVQKGAKHPYYTTTSTSFPLFLKLQIFLHPSSKSRRPPLSPPDKYGPPKSAFSLSSLSAGGKEEERDLLW